MNEINEEHDIERFTTKYIDELFAAASDMDGENAEPGYETPEDGSTVCYLNDEGDDGYTICADTFNGSYGNNDCEPTEPVEAAETREEAVEKMSEILN